MSEPVWQWSAVETARAIRAGEISSAAVVEAHLARMDAVNPAINAVVTPLHDEARKAARDADRAQASGAALGPLHGVPVTLKINVDVAGQANSNGVVAFRHNIAREDSPVTANLKRAGAIIIGMTNTPEFSMRAFTDNPLHGLTLNPWDQTITCGGSSGGAGASIASGIGAIAHGNDIGGSLRWPAYCNGVVTIKPTQGRVPAFNPSASEERPPMAQLMSVQGPLARSVADVRLGFEIMAAPDPRDPWYAPVPLAGPPVARKVAVARIPDDMACDDDVIALYREAADHLVDAGYELHEVEVPELSRVWTLWRDLLFTELAVMQAPLMRQVGSETFIRGIEAALRSAPVMDIEGYMKSVAERTRLLRVWMAFLDTYPVLLTPLSVRRTPGPNADIDGSGRNIMWETLRFLSSINVLGLPAAIVPVGLARGAPVGVQLVATRYREDLCLDAAAAIEQRAGRLVERLWTMMEQR